MSATNAPKTTVYEVDTRHAHLNVRRACMRAKVACGLASNVVSSGLILHTPVFFDPYAIPRYTGAQASALRVEFAEWVAISSLRDVAESFEIFLDYVHARLQEGLMLRGKDKKVAEKEHKNYARVSCKLKSQALEAIDATLIIPYLSEFETVTVLRNCVTHRAGIVHDVDVNDPAQNSLRVKWLGFDPKLELDDGSFLPITEAAPEGGATVSAIVVSRNRVFPVGTRVSINPHEVAEILMAYDLSAEVVVSHLRRVVLSWFPDAQVEILPPKVPGADLR